MNELVVLSDAELSELYGGSFWGAVGGVFTVIGGAAGVVGGVATGGVGGGLIAVGGGVAIISGIATIANNI